MFSLKKIRDTKGFTIIELLIVIAVIAILAGIVAVAYSHVTDKARDTTRQNNITEIQSQLEIFYANNNYYPSLDNLNDSTWLSANMKGLDSAIFSDPLDTSNTTLEAGSGTPKTAQKGDKKYAYDATGCTTDSDGNDECTGYTLSAYLESGSTYTKKSLN